MHTMVSNDRDRRQLPGNETGVLRWPLSRVIFTIAGLPFFSFVTVIFISFVKNYDQSVSTHCNVANYLPTISAAISLSPQKYVWRIGIALHTLPRILGAMVIYDIFSSIPTTTKWYKGLCRTTEMSHIVEVLCLLGLTMVSSREYKPMHENFFITFMVMSLINMLLTNIQLYLSKGKHWRDFNTEERYYQRLFLGVFLFNISAFFISLYFYFRHNIYCEPGMYTWYAFFEYLVVLSNIGFHVLEVAQFKNRRFLAGLSVSIGKTD